MIEFRPYQQIAIDTARARIGAGIKRILINAATGAGKTIIAAGITQRAVSKGKRVLFLAHRRELIEQCAAKLQEAGVLNFGIIMARNRMVNHLAPVQIASVQTLLRRELPPVDIIIIDEAHRANARSYLSILANYANAVVLGLSATPERLDGKGLDDIFDDLVVVETIPNLIDQGFLVRPRCFIGPTANLDGVRTRRGDYDEQQLAERMDRPKLVGDIIANWQRMANGCRTVVFAANVNHAQHIAEEFWAAAVPAAVISGDTPIPEREAILADWRSGALKVVANVYVLCEGFDMPELECCILARPTQSLSLYLQMAGRIMRPAAAKRGALLLDHAGCCKTHGQPHIHREWSLESMTPKRKRDREKAAGNLLECGDCHLAFHAEPKLWLAETQPSLRKAFYEAARELLGANASLRALHVCPGCGAAECILCGTSFKPNLSRAGIDRNGIHRDGIDTDSTEGSDSLEAAAICPTCNARYTGDVAHSESESVGGEVLLCTDEALVEMGEEVPMRVVVLNEYRRLINKARQHGYRRGWAFHRLCEKYDESVVRDCIPRRTANWWQARA